MSVSIELLDVNDEPPEFTMQPQPYLTTINPDLPTGSPVDYAITVSDGDANSFFEFSLLSGR